MRENSCGSRETKACVWAEAPSGPQAWVPSFPAPLQGRLRPVPMASLQAHSPSSLGLGDRAWGDRIGVGGGCGGTAGPGKACVDNGNSDPVLSRHRSPGFCLWGSLKAL